jgi:homopolymeric O-antigen transport system permease protein
MIYRIMQPEATICEVTGARAKFNVELPVTIIEASTRWRLPNLGELVAYRDLLAFFVLRDIKVRYRQTLLGAGWAILQPLLTMVIMTFVFGRLIGLRSDGAPYALFCFAGLVLWTYITQAVIAASSSVVSNSQLIEKVYFPRLAIPVAAALAGLLDFSISFAMLFVMMLSFGYPPSIGSVLCIPLALIAAVLAIGIGSMLAALSVRFRDVSHLIPFLVQLWLFASPIAYPASLLPPDWQLVLALNPVTGLVELFRWAILGTTTHPWPLFGISMLSLSIVVPLGLLIFERMERSFADMI